MAYEMLANLDTQYHVIWLHHMMCEATRCRSHIGDTYLDRDTGHFSIEGAKWLGEQHDFYGLITGRAAQLRTGPLH
jgi:hypothetical protein